MNITPQDYCQAIDTLMSRDVEIDYRTIVVKLAKKNPALFNSLYAELVADNKRVAQPVDPDAVTLRTIYHHMENGHKVDAIKAMRVISGMGLKEAKDTIDNAMEQLAAEFGSRISYPSCTPDRVYGNCRNWLDRLVAVYRADH